MRLVTSDVFDTIVTRDAARPSDVFVSLGHELADAGLLPPDVTPHSFEQARRNAERTARRRIAVDLPTDRAAECTLAEVWGEMPDVLVDDVDAMIARELAHEARRLSPVEPAIEALRSARRAGVPVVLVSDIYLSAVQLEGLLRAIGVPDDSYDEIVTSADHRRSKADGLLDAVIRGRGVDPTAVVHLGDHEIADVATAAALGARPVHVELPDDDRHVERPTLAMRFYSRGRGGDGGITSTMRAMSLGSPHGLDPAWQFGAIGLGPALTGFARWASVTTERLGAPTIHCLLREGGTIADLIGIVRPDGPTTRLVHASRWVDMRAAVVDGTIDEVRAALVRRGPTSVDHVVRAFGCDPDRVRAAWGGQDAIRPDVLDRAVARLIADDDVRDQIVAGAAELRRRVLRQLDRELDLDGDGPIVVCDVGWGGSIQTALERILRAGGVRRPVVGLYFALSATGEERAAMGADLRAYLPTILDDEEISIATRTVAHHADSIERVLTPAIGTLVDVDDDGTPVTADEIEPQPSTLQLARSGVIDMARALAARGLDDAVWVDDPALRAMFAESLAELVAHPSPRIAAALLDWPHDDVGGQHLAPLGGEAVADLVRWSNLRDVETLRRTEPAWIEGIAASTNPALAVQIAAAQRGLPAGELVPPSECGVSRLSAFPVDSDLADPQVAERLAMHPEGWSVLRLRAPYRSLRAIRFDAGDVDAMVQVERFDITIAPADGAATTRSLDDLRVGDLGWVDAVPCSADRYAESAGGHLVVPVDADLGSGPGDLDVIVVFRRWAIAADDPALRPGIRRQATDAIGRLRRVVTRLRP